MNQDLMIHRFLLLQGLNLKLRLKIEVMLQKKHTYPIYLLDFVNQATFLCLFSLIRWASRARFAVWIPKNIQSTSFCSVRALIR